MKRRFYLFFAIVSFALFSCSNPIADILLRTYNDPLDVAPTVDSFKENNKIYISWEDDEGCDEYILMRATDSISPVFSQIYRGKDLGYIDTSLNENTKYLYRLDKTRGSKRFNSTKKGYGYCSRHSRDDYNNHVQENAVHLYKSINNLFLYNILFADGTRLFEEDWFYVKVPACNLIVLHVNQTFPRLQDPAIEYLFSSQRYDDVGQNFQFENVKLVDDIIYFKLKAKAPENSDGNNLINYEIQISQIQPIN